MRGERSELSCQVLRHLPSDRILSEGAGGRLLIPVAGGREEKDVPVMALRRDVPAKVLWATLLLSPFTQTMCEPREVGQLPRVTYKFSRNSVPRLFNRTSARTLRPPRD